MKPTDRPPSGSPTGRPPSAHDDGVLQHSDDHELHNDDVAHEHSDINLRALVTSGVVLVAVAVVSQILMYLLFGVFESRAAKNDPPQSPLAAGRTQMPATTVESPIFNATVVDAPQLLTNEPMALDRYRADQNQRLGSYGWVDEATGVTRLPIDAAKVLIAERGLPVREDGLAPQFRVRSAARGEASGGRMLALPPVEDQEPAAAAPAPQHAEPAAKPQGGH
jgi:hypothetical protein